MVRGCDLDTLAMSHSDAKTLETIARNCRFSPGTSKEAADLSIYEIDIEDGRNHHRLSADDLTATPELVQLVEQLMKFAKPQPLE